MPRRDDLKKILIIGSGPIVIGQACEFDYSGTQACKALREEGYEVVLVNSNPATIMTDPATADRTYIEPLTWEIVAKVIEKERPDALLPTLGGQTGLNLAMDLWRHGVLEKYGVEMIGANADVIDKAESRDRFQQAMQKIGLDLPQGKTVRNVEEARDVARRDRPAGGRAAQLHAGRQRLGDRLQPRRVRSARAPRARSVARAPGADRGIDHRLERVRDGGDARHGRQRRDHLLDRELRPDGRSHGRLDHGGPGPDADRQGIPADARRLAGRDPRDRRRDGRLEHSVRDPSARRAG